MKKYFIESEKVILPYESATQSGVIVDAYKYSRPVICFDVGGLAEQVKHKKTGYLIQNQNLENFSKQLNSFFQLSMIEKKKISHDAWKFGYIKYSFQNSQDRVNSLLEKIKTNKMN